MLPEAQACSHLAQCARRDARHDVAGDDRAAAASESSTERGRGAAGEQRGAEPRVHYNHAPVVTQPATETGTVSKRLPMFSAPRSLIWVTAATLGLSGVAAAAANGVSALMVYTYARPRRMWGTGEPPAGLAEEVTFESPEDNMPLRGWFLPATNASKLSRHRRWCCATASGRDDASACRWRSASSRPATTYSASTSARMGRAAAASSAWATTRPATSSAPSSWLTARPEVDRRRIGVLGFSMGAAAAIQAAARSQDIAAVAADSGYAELVDAVRYSFRRVGRLPHYPFGPLALYWARVMLRVDARQMRPIDEIGRISPRPVLLLHGAEDQIVPVQPRPPPVPGSRRAQGPVDRAEPGAYGCARSPARCLLRPSRGLLSAGAGALD